MHTKAGLGISMDGVWEQIHFLYSFKLEFVGLGGEFNIQLPSSVCQIGPDPATY